LQEEEIWCILHLPSKQGLRTCTIGDTDTNKLDNTVQLCLYLPIHHRDPRDRQLISWSCCSGNSLASLAADLTGSFPCSRSSLSVSCLFQLSALRTVYVHGRFRLASSLPVSVHPSSSSISSSAKPVSVTPMCSKGSAVNALPLSVGACD
jgi:hypothetical protein